MIVIGFILGLGFGALSLALGFALMMMRYWK